MLIFFAVFTIVASLVAWRASPIYSLKSTFKLAGAAILIVAVVIGGTDLIYSNALSRWPAVQIVAGLAAFLIVTTGAMVMIVRITDSHVAQLAPSVKLVTLHRHGILRWFWRLVVYLLINGAAAIALPSSWNWLPLFLGGFVLLICGPMLGLAYMMARRNDRGMTSVIANPWVHWQYSAEQWQAWIANQMAWEKTRETPWKWKGAVKLILLCAALFALGVLFDGGFTGENTLVFCILCGFILLVILAFYIAVRAHPGRRLRVLRAAPPEAWLGSEGVFCNGEYTPWILSGRYLIGAAAESGPPAAVVLTFESFNGSTSYKIFRRVLVPPDRAPELAPLDKKLAACCATANVHLTPV
jgi:hypothetical protein